jgi:hypothetical protein
MSSLVFPPHKCGLFLTHTEHRDYYESAAEWIAQKETLMDGAEGLWKDAEARQRAIDTDEVWVLQWYPETPVGFNIVLAPTLEELLARAAES